jgi:hypothetical protein
MVITDLSLRKMRVTVYFEYTLNVEIGNILCQAELQELWK